MFSLRSVFLAGFIGLFALPVWAEADVQRLLNGLGVNAASAQADRVIKQSLRQLESRGDLQAQNLAQQQQLSKQLLLASGAEAIAASTAAYLAQHMPAAGVAAEMVLSTSLGARIRNLDIAMEANGAYQEFQQYVIQLEAVPPSDARLVLITRLDAARHTSAIAALLQSELALSAQLVALKMAGKPRPKSERVTRQQQYRLRQQHMASVVNQLDLFSYRFLRDEELEHYVMLMERDDIQAVMNVCMQGLQQALQAGRAISLAQIR